MARTAKYDMTIRTKTKDGLSQLYAAWSKRDDVVSYSILPL